MSADFWLQVGDRVSLIDRPNMTGTIDSIDWNLVETYGVTTCFIQWDVAPNALDIQWTNKIQRRYESISVKIILPNFFKEQLEQVNNTLVAIADGHDAILKSRKDVAMQAVWDFDLGEDPNAINFMARVSLVLPECQIGKIRRV